MGAFFQGILVKGILCRVPFQGSSKEPFEQQLFRDLSEKILSEL